MEKISAIKGVKDILPPETTVWQFVQEKAREIFHTFGYEEILIPIFESTKLFSRSIGETTDIVEKEMYTFEDRDGKSLTLRPEGTASVVRAFIEHHLHAASPSQKLYYIGPMFRRERPQAGRYRQFYQIGSEAFGVSHPGMDAEIISMIHTLFQTLRIGNVTLHLNSLGCPDCRPAYRTALRAFFSGKRELLCPECQRRLDLNPLRILDCKVPSCREIVVGAPRTLDFLCVPCRTHFDGLLQQLNLLNIPCLQNPMMVRGLDYYTRTAFEFISTSLGAQNTVAAGGRYDLLVEELGGPATPAVGFSLGVERLITLLDKNRGPEDNTRLFIAALGEAAQHLALPLLQKLREAGIPSAMDYEGASLKSQMRKADKARARHVLILGENELQQGKALLRDMRDKTQEEIPLSSLENVLKKKLT
ncbi:MAG: histidine--tRNA ligase [Nitrospirae bacterium]|nr:histidine--tRNA ligase [Nitrospirota bacterium]